MNYDWLLRTKTLIGLSAVEALSQSSVAVLGLGGVGGAAAEALCRAGVGKLILMDHDYFDLTNLNRQILATLPDVGKPKTQIAKERFSSINPNCEIIPLTEFYTAENSNCLFDQQPDFILDAIDTVTSKLHLMQSCYQRGVPLISSMGTGNRMDPTQFHIGDISETAGCGCNLAKVIRRELRKRDVPNQTVLYSTEIPRKLADGFVGEASHGRHSPASISFTPPVAGYIMAAYVVQKLIERTNS